MRPQAYNAYNPGRQALVDGGSNNICVRGEEMPVPSRFTGLSSAKEEGQRSPFYFITNNFIYVMRGAGVSWSLDPVYVCMHVYYVQG